MIEKNQELEVEIVSYGSEGQGVARYDNFVIFVPMSIIGEIVKVHIIKVTKSYAVGKIIEVIKPSEYRCNSKCSVYGKCGGCVLQHIDYLKTLEMKKQIVQDALVKIADIKDVAVKDVVKSKFIYNYRNKSAFPLFVDDGEIEVCMFRNLSHDPVYVENCKISDENINKIAEIFKVFANNSLSKKDLQTLRFLVVRVIDNKFLVTIVSDIPIKNLVKLYYELTTKLGISDGNLGLFWCKKSKDNNVILEGTIKHLLGVKNISANILGVNIELSPMSFFQVNYDIMTKIYSKVQSVIEKTDSVIDAYSGAGLMSALIAQKAKHVYGIEIVPDATKNADALKFRNNIKNLTNINGDISIILPKLVEEDKNIDVLVLDPPRKGIDEVVLNTILSVKPNKIIYVSCNPATLARDLKVLSEAYDMVEVEPYDMFPQTAHVETFALLERKK